jgi:hypothetical protein
VKSTLDLPPPLGGPVPTVSLPDDLPPKAAMVGVLRIAFSAPAAIAAKGPVRSPAGLMAAALLRRVRLWGTPAWAEQAARDADSLTRLATIRRPDDLDRMGDLLTPPAGSDPRVARWTRALLGHSVGRHGDDCPPCGAAAAGDWPALLAACDSCPPALIADLARSLTEGGYLTRPVVRVAPEVDF